MRDRLVVLVLSVIAVAVVGGAFYAVTTREVRDPQAEAEAAIDAFLTTWEQQDLEALPRLVADPSQPVAATHAQLTEALQPEAIRLTRKNVIVEGPVARVDVDVEVDLPDADTATWTTFVGAERIEGTWQVRWNPATVHPDLRLGWTFDVVEEPAGRASILAHDGTPLTEPGELITVGIEPRRIEDEGDFRSDIELLLPEALDELDELLARDDLRPTWFYPVITLRSDRWEQVSADVRALPGVVVRTEQARVGSDDGFALHVLGRVGAADEDEAAELGVLPGTDVGRYGLEAVLEETLTGTPAFDVVLRDEDGEVRDTIHRYQGDAPTAVTTTLDREVQRAVENALVGVSSPVGIVVIDVASGGVRATASRPLDGFNRAWAGKYPPGSTFKIVTALAGMRGDLDPTSEVACPAEESFGGLRLRNAGGLELGTTTLEEAFTFSCNTTFASIAVDAGATVLGRAAGDLGFGQELRMPLDVFGGSFPAPADTAELAAAGIGQARVEASPLLMASVAAGVANGRWQAPFLLGEDLTATTITRPSDRTSGPPLNDIVVGDLRAMMESVVARGTGTAAQVPGEPAVAGKTGSAEFGSGDPKPTHAWFVGYRGPYAFAVLVEGGGSGGEVAAPLAGRLLRELAALTD